MRRENTTTSNKGGYQTGSIKNSHEGERVRLHTNHQVTGGEKREREGGGCPAIFLHVGGAKQERQLKGIGPKKKKWRRVTFLWGHPMKKNTRKAHNEEIRGEKRRSGGPLETQARAVKWVRGPSIV